VIIRIAFERIDCFIMKVEEVIIFSNVTGVSFDKRRLPLPG